MFVHRIATCLLLEHFFKRQRDKMWDPFLVATAEWMVMTPRHFFVNLVDNMDMSNAYRAIARDIHDETRDYDTMHSCHD